MSHESLRVAIACGTLHLPRMHFVVSHVAAMSAVEGHLFSVAVDRPDLSPLPVTQNISAGAVPYAVARRTYPLSRLGVGRSVRGWHPDLINLHFLALGGFAASAARDLGVPLVSTVHAVEPFLDQPATTLRRRALRADCRRAFDTSHRLLAVSSYIAEWLLSLGADPARVDVCHLGIDSAFWSPVTAPGQRRSRPSVAFVGHLSELKGIRDLIQVSCALAGEAPHELHIVGDGPLRREVDEAAQKFDHITVHGVLSRPEVRTVVGSCTLLALPTQSSAGIEDAAPTVLLEAQSLGVPVLAYAVGGVPEMVSSEDSVVAAGDRQALSHAMKVRLSESDDVYSRRASEARNWVLARRSIDITSGNLRRSFVEVVGSA